jgi:hypothetical protein
MDHPTRRFDEPLRERSEVCIKCEGKMVWAKSVAHIYSDPVYYRSQHGMQDGFYNQEKPVYMARLVDLPGPYTQYCVCVALVCTSCGYTELYTHDPQLLIRE